MADSFNTMPEPPVLSSFRAFAIAFEWPLHARCSTVAQRSEALKSRKAMVVVGPRRRANVQSAKTAHFIPRDRQRIEIADLSQRCRG
jgi:hypothetical protein